MAILTTTVEGCLVAKIGTGLLSVVSLLIIVSMLFSGWTDIKHSAGAASPDNLSQDLMSVIPAAHLFGMQLPDSTTHLPSTTAALQLTGLMQLQDPQGVALSKAIIAVGDGIGKVYQEGDILPGGIVLVAMRADGVLLNNRGHWERLSLRLEK